MSRVLNKALRSKIMSAEEAASLIQTNANVGMSGFTGSGYPKEVPRALAVQIARAHIEGRPFQIGVWTGASTAPELDGALAMADAIRLRLPYQSEPVTRKRINAGDIEYVDIHLSHVPQYVGYGFFGKLDFAIIEVTAIREDGQLVPCSSLGNNKTWLDHAENIILEVNSWQNEKLEGMHDIFYSTADPPNRQPIPIIHADDRIGSPYLRCDPSKIVAIVETDDHDRNSPFSPPDAISNRIAGHILDFLEHEVKRGRLPEKTLLPLQSGVGNIANAVLIGLQKSDFEGMTAYTEVIQDGMLDMLDTGTLLAASATAFSLSPQMLEQFNRKIDFYHDKIILRSQGISNHPEVIRRLGVIAMNGMVEADIYGNVNSTHIMGTKIQNGVGGSGDFARNAFLSFFMTPSTAKNGAISAIVPMVSHVDHTEHDTQIIVTENGLADLRGLSPKQRARVIIDNCAHPDYKPALDEYFHRALAMSPGKQTPHLMEEAFSWHTRFIATDHM